MNRRNDSVLYINFSPYENAGNILDYLRLHFNLVCLFSLNFHKLGALGEGSSISIYKNGKLVGSKRLFTIIIPHGLVFLFLPIRSVIIFSQIMYHTYLLTRRYGPFTYVLSVNAFTTWIANILRSLGAVHKTVFWVWDYYPTAGTNLLVAFMRWVYLFFDKHATRHSDRVVFLNKRLVDVRVRIGLYPPNTHVTIVPIGTNPVVRLAKLTRGRWKFAFLGVVKESQGLEIFLHAYAKIKNRIGPVELHVVGSGPKKEYLQKQSSRLGIRATFYGYVKKESEINDIISHCHIGLAPYVPGESNVSYYTDPSKIKMYLSLGLPVVTTNICLLAEELTKARAGVVFNYGNTDSFVRAVERVFTNHSQYRKGALRLAQQYDYRSLYKEIFESLR